jgi:hypothetical protein
MNAAATPSLRRGRARRVGLAGLVSLAGLLAAGAILYAGCVSPQTTVEGPVSRSLKRMRAESDLRKPAPPEEEWNAAALWVRVGSGPAAYIPRGYGRNLPRNEAWGKWYADARDGKRLFVPHGGAGEVPEGVLRGEAIKVTLWREGRAIPGVQEAPVARLRLD